MRAPFRSARLARAAPEAAARRESGVPPWLRSFGSVLSLHENLQKLRIRTEDGGSLIVENFPVRLQGAKEFIEARIPGVSLAVDPRGLGVAGPTHFFRFLVSHR